ncbi:MAG: hypothetical protein LM573_06125, partial [Thermofilum sp.]|nr:hypothetical protein [Thermofilum sp.]
MWQVAILTYLPPPEALSKAATFFSSNGWELYQEDNVYIFERSSILTYLSFALLATGVILLIGSFLSPSNLPLAFIFLFIGAILYHNKHTIALALRENALLIATDSYEAFKETLLFAETINGKIIHAEAPTTPPTTLTLQPPDTATALRELETKVLKIFQTTSQTQPITDKTQLQQQLTNEIATYQSYLEKLEKLKEEGKITEKAYVDLKNEYTQKIAELQKQLQQA